jgi:integral membrane protein
VSLHAVLLRYRIMAYVVGSLLIVLALVGVPLKYLASDGSTAQNAGIWITMYLGILHGWLYMIFLVTAAMLARSARFPLGFAVLVLLLGTVPIASFVAERLATRRTRETFPALAAGSRRSTESPATPTG